MSISSRHGVMATWHREIDMALQVGPDGPGCSPAEESDPPGVGVKHQHRPFGRPRQLHGGPVIHERREPRIPGSGLRGAADERRGHPLVGSQPVVLHLHPCAELVASGVECQIVPADREPDWGCPRRRSVTGRTRGRDPVTLDPVQRGQPAGIVPGGPTQSRPSGIRGGEDDRDQRRRRSTTGGGDP